MNRPPVGTTSREGTAIGVIRAFPHGNTPDRLVDAWSSCGIVDGQIGIDVARSPLMWFTGYRGESAHTPNCFTSDGWYLTGDAGWSDPEGRFYFGGRNDDIILMAGYRISPHDIENVLIKHPLVDDVAVVGRRDTIRGEIVEAFVVIAAETNGGGDLKHELQQLVKVEYAAHAYPRRIHFVESLPRTASGKIQRHALRDR